MLMCVLFVLCARIGVHVYLHTAYMCVRMFVNVLMCAYAYAYVCVRMFVCINV
jgi:hypothetical protein